MSDWICNRLPIESDADSQGCVIIATDGTAWCRVQNPDKEAHWQRLPDLPQP
jgi:hypothetical protein